LDDDSYFLHPDWWERLRASANLNYGFLGVLTGSLNNLNSLETTLPEEHLKTLNKEPGPPFVHTTSFITPHFAFFRRELILQLGYVDCTEHYFASEYEEYLRRANRALGRNPDQYFIIPNTTKSLAIYNDPMEDWIHSESFDKQRLLLTANPEVKALHTRYQDKPPSYQINKHHGLQYHYIDRAERHHAGESPERA
jgi:hypothetical protein